MKISIRKLRNVLVYAGTLMVLVGCSGSSDSSNFVHSGEKSESTSQFIIGDQNGSNTSTTVGTLEFMTNADFETIEKNVHNIVVPPVKLC